MKKANRDAFRKWTCPILNPNHKQKVKCVNIICTLEVAKSKELMLKREENCYHKLLRLIIKTHFKLQMQFRSHLAVSGIHGPASCVLFISCLLEYFAIFR